MGNLIIGTLANSEGPDVMKHFISALFVTSQSIFTVPEYFVEFLVQ